MDHSDISGVSREGEGSDFASFFKLKWNEFPCTLSLSVSSTRDEEALVDVSLVSGGRRWSAHKLVLCAASPLFKTLLMDNPSDHPLIIFNEEFEDHLSSILDFIYSGCVKVPESSLSEFQELAEYLQITGLAVSDKIDREEYASSMVGRKHNLSPDPIDLPPTKKSCPSTTSEHSSFGPSSPYSLLEPKLEIHDDPVEYSEMDDESSMLYSSAYPSQDYSESVPSESSFHDPLESHPPERSYETRENALRDLLSITSRLGEMDSSRQSFADHNIEPGPDIKHSTGQRMKAPSYPTTPVNSRVSIDRSIVPYVPPQQDPLTASLQRPSRSGPGQNLRWEEPRFCPACQKSYSNNSNYRRHFKYVPTCLSKLESLGYAVS